MPYIYLASPYSHPSADVRLRRYREACRATAWLLARGRTVYSPIVHSHVLAAEWGLAGDWAFWERHDLTMLAHAESLVILGLDRWRTSRGVMAELEFFRAAHPQRQVGILLPDLSACVPLFDSLAEMPIGLTLNERI